MQHMNSYLLIYTVWTPHNNIASRKFFTDGEPEQYDICYVSENREENHDLNLQRFI